MEKQLDPRGEIRTALNFALANVESAAGGNLTGDLGRAASFIGDALRLLDGREWNEFPEGPA